MKENKPCCTLLSGAKIFISIAIFICLTARADNWNVQGEHGELEVYGTLTEGACLLGMTSSNQQIDVGEVSRQMLRHPGDSAAPVAFELRLDRCGREGGVQQDRYGGGLSWDSQQPVITVSFLAPVTAEMPSLIEASGISGLGLRIEDSNHRTVIPGERGKPLFLTPGSNVLAYTVTPVRTAAPLIAGAFRATVNFQVNYD